jgi:hypothetical protein
MIKIPTVLILGAGASMPYGYPSGKQLKDIICSMLPDPESDLSKKLRELGHEPVDVAEFEKALFYSGKNSVDAFLEYRMEFVEIGKAAMAYVLMSYENPRILFEKHDWYEHFYSALSTSFEEFDQNRVSIITFNYDRSVEHYLFTVLKNSYGKSDHDCASKLKNIPIVHVHGQLGFFPWQDYIQIPYPFRSNQFSRSYGFSDKIGDLRVAASCIRIIHEDEDVEGDPQFKKARSLLEQAGHIHFLGFGYHEANLKRLGILLARGTTFAGTAYGLELSERYRIGKLFGNNALSLATNDLDNLLYLRRMVNLE